LPKKKRLLILAPSFGRRKGDGLLPTLERYDGLFYRVARKVRAKYATWHNPEI